MLTAAIMQPTYLPWIGYFDLIDQVDIFVFLDSVQLVKRSWQVRNRIRSVDGELFLTLPIRKIKTRDETFICTAYIDNSNLWKEKHLRSIELLYKKALYFQEVFPFIKELIKNSESIVSGFNINIIQSIIDKLSIKTKFFRSSKLKNAKGKKDSLLVSICKEIGCSRYISPQGAAGYIEDDFPGGEFAKNGISLYYQNYEHPVYNQLYGNFMPYLAIIDLLFNHGFERSPEIIRSGRREPIDYSSFRRDVLNVT